MWQFGVVQSCQRLVRLREKLLQKSLKDLLQPQRSTRGHLGRVLHRNEPELELILGRKAKS